MAMSEEYLIKELIQNNISLQKALIKLVENTDKLNKRIEHLVNIFEEASKHVGEVDNDRMRQLTMKLDGLLDQNRDLAKGLVLLEKYVREKSFNTPL